MTEAKDQAKRAIKQNKNAFKSKMLLHSVFILYTNLHTFMYCETPP